MSNYCVNCTHFSRGKHLVRDSCRHPSNVVVSQVYGPQRRADDILTIRLEYCKGNWFTEKPYKEDKQ